jgi:hypothetical protein
MKITRTLTLATAMAVAAIGFGSTAAHAARIGVGVYVGGPVAYVPPSPGPGYLWVAGYYNGPYWVPGRWSFVGVRGPAYYGGYARGWDRDHVRIAERDHFRDGRGWGHDRR